MGDYFVNEKATLLAEKSIWIEDFKSVPLYDAMGKYQQFCYWLSSWLGVYQLEIYVLASFLEFLCTPSVIHKKNLIICCRLLVLNWVTCRWFFFLFISRLRFQRFIQGSKGSLLGQEVPDSVARVESHAKRSTRSNMMRSLL